MRADERGRMRTQDPFLIQSCSKIVLAIVVESGLSVVLKFSRLFEFEPGFGEGLPSVPLEFDDGV